MNTLLEAAQQALEALEGDPNAMIAVAEGHWDFKRDLAITALRAALAEPVQEPVAWRYWHSNGDGTESESVYFGREFPSYKTPLRPPVPLYTAPHQRPPLTYEEIRRLWYDSGAGIELSRFSSIVRAAERAHKIGVGA